MSKRWRRRLFKILSAWLSLVHMPGCTWNHKAEQIEKMCLLKEKWLVLHEKKARVCSLGKKLVRSLVLYFCDYIFRCDRFLLHVCKLVEIANSSIFQESRVLIVLYCCIVRHISLTRELLKPFLIWFCLQLASDIFTMQACMAAQWEFQFTSDYFPGFGQGISQAQTVLSSRFRALLFFTAHHCQISKDANTAQCVTVLSL